MKVAPAKAATAYKQNVSPEAVQANAHATKSFPAPVRGLIQNENLSSSGPAGAYVLDNWFPTQTGIRLRKGSFKHATVSAIDKVEKLFTYKSGSTEVMFAATNDSVFDISSPVDRDTPPTPEFTGQSNGYYSAQQFGTAGGDFLYIVNGADDARFYDGTSWAAINTNTTPHIQGVDSNVFSQVWSFANRLFFIEKQTLDAWYLPVDSIAGAANQFSLNGIMRMGGELVFGGRWSLDAGDGLDDKCIFVSSEGEVAIYEGTNPGSASEWRLAGLYRIGKPIGKNCTMQAGGDLLIATDMGLVPLSAAIQKDYAALNLSAVSSRIKPTWEKSYSDRGLLPWEVAKWPSENMMVISQPRATESILPQSLVVNLETGAWCRFTGQDVRCLALFDDFLFFGANNGCVYRMEATGADDGVPYTGVYVGLYDQMNALAAHKLAMQARATFIASVPFNVRVSASSNYQPSLPAAPSSVPNFVSNEWDTGLWDQAIWDGSEVGFRTTRWVSTPAQGYSLAPQIQVTSGTDASPTIELVSFDMTYNVGGVVV